MLVGSTKKIVASRLSGRNKDNVVIHGIILAAVVIELPWSSKLQPKPILCLGKLNNHPTKEYVLITNL